jgi:hypothetical protein
MANRAALPLCVYGMAALVCGFTPWRLALEDGSFAVNTIPAGAFALATVALTLVHWVFTLQGRLAKAIACFWAVATTALATCFLIAPPRSVPAVWEAIRWLLTLALAGAAASLAAAIWQVARRRLALDAHLIPRALVILGMAGLVFIDARFVLQGLGSLLAAPLVPVVTGIDELAAEYDALQLALWIDSAVLLLSAVLHLARFRPGSQRRPI